MSRWGSSSRWGSTRRSVDPNVAAQWAKYEIISQRNIFNRNRTPPRPPEPPRPPVVPPNPESYLVLKGIVQENDEFFAFVEDSRSGLVQRLRRGDSVARGTITALTLDTIEYRLEDKTISIQMGHDLEGNRGTVRSYSSPDWSSSTTLVPDAEPNGTAPPAAPAGDEADILRRLMEQRKQQLGQ